MQKLFCFIVIISMVCCRGKNQDKPVMDSGTPKSDPVKAASVADTFARSAACVYEKSKVPRTKTFPFSKSTKVEVLSFGRKHVSGRISGDDYKTFPTDKRVVLSDLQTDSLFSILHNVKSFATLDSVTKDCYMPNHAILFSNQGKTIAFIEICFSCQKTIVTAGAEFPYCEQKLCMLQYFFHSLNIRDNDDMSLEECEFIFAMK